MSFWGIMNWVAWMLCAVFAYLIASDFISVEKEILKNKKKNQ
ncbi:hypothetical protein SH2C18_41750 [Clostridium sediminicola]